MDSPQHEALHRSCNRFIPFATLFIFICINRPVILLAITFMLNYLIMGINRYHSIPIAITNIFDLLYGIMLALILLKQLQSIIISGKY